jgi:phospholipid-translocating ATPase
MNLDGETNLKVKQGLEATSSLLNQDSDFKDFRGVVRCEDPNVNLYVFVGTLALEEERFPLSIQQILLRDSKLRNTEYVYGAVVFTGHDTKVHTLFCSVLILFCSVLTLFFLLSCK